MENLGDIIEELRTVQSNEVNYESGDHPIPWENAKRKRLNRKRRNSSRSQGSAYLSPNGHFHEEGREENRGGGPEPRLHANGRKQEILPIQEDHQARFYARYRKVADEYDKEFLEKCDEDLNTTLIFAGLFSAVASAFILQVDTQLQPDSGEETAALLRVLIYEINNSAFGGDVPSLPQWTGPPPSLVLVEVILFASLVVSLLCAFLAMLGKQWLGLYASADMRGSAVERSQNRQRKLDGIVAWYFDHVMGSLPLMMQASLFFLGAALSRYYWDINPTIALVILSITSFGGVFYLFIAIAGAAFENCPYQTPGSNILRYLGSKIWRIIRSVRPTVGLILENAFENSSIIGTTVSSGDLRNPWRRRENIPFSRDLILNAPRGLANDVCRLGRTTMRTLLTLPIRFSHVFRTTNRRLNRVHSSLRRRLNQQTALPVFRCISWTLQTSLDKPIHLTALNHLETITELTGLDPTLVADCFNVFAGCVSFSNDKLVVMQGLEQLATVSARCFFNTFHHLWATDSTSSVLVDVRRRYTRAFPVGTDFGGLPFYHTMTVAHALAHERWDLCNLRWDDYSPPCQEHIPFARHMVEVARVEYRRMQHRKVPRWILRFALHSLSLDPHPPASVVANCLTIIAIDLNCDIPNLTTLDESARVDQVSNLITQKLKVMADVPSTGISTLLWSKHKAITALFPYSVRLEQNGQREMVDVISRAAGGSRLIFECRRPGEYKDIRVWQAGPLSDTMEEINTYQGTQEEAILWSPQKPLDPTESKAVVSTMALISSSPPYRFPTSAVVFLNLALESLFAVAPNKAQMDVAVDCLLVLGHIKYQSVVDRNWDQDRNVGGIPVTALVAWAAQQLATDALEEDFNTPRSEGTWAHLLMAATWLSPVGETEEIAPDGEKLRIQDRWEFVEKLRVALAQRVCSDNPDIDNQVLVNLIRGMHACIPRGNYGSPSSVVSFLPSICDDYGSPWSGDESVLRALITYALDLLLSSTTRKPLVERGVEFDELASELIDVLTVDTTSPDVIAFGFWLIYRVPYAFTSRKSTLADIVYIWASTNKVIPQDLRRRMNFYAVDAFNAVAQHHASANHTLPTIATYNTLNLLKAALEEDCTRPMATYMAAIILDPGISAQAASFARGFDAESFTKTSHTIGSETSRTEDIVDLHIYSTLALLKLRQPQVDVERSKGLIEEMEKVIGDSFVRDSGFTMDSEVETRADLDRVKWKAIYLCGRLFQVLPPGEREGPIERVREMVRRLLENGRLTLAGDYERCVESLGICMFGLGPAGGQGESAYTVFETWVKGFPLSHLVGSISVAGPHAPPKTRKRRLW